MRSGGYSSLSMFIERCEVQLSSAIVVSMLQYLIRSFAETCTEHEHTTDTQNEKENTSPEFVFFFFFFC